MSNSIKIELSGGKNHAILFSGKTPIGKATYTTGDTGKRKQYFYYGQGLTGMNEALLMDVVLALRALDNIKNTLDEYLIKEPKEKKKKGNKRR